VEARLSEKLMLFHAIIEPADGLGLNHRTSAEAPDEQRAIEMLEAIHGRGRIVKVWMDHEQSTLLPDSVVRQK
jgi:hypothetical protein